MADQATETTVPETPPAAPPAETPPPPPPPPPPTSAEPPPSDAQAAPAQSEPTPDPAKPPPPAKALPQRQVIEQVRRESDRQKRLRAERAEIEQARKDAEAYRTLMEQAKTDPLGAIQQAGLKFEDLAQAALAQSSDPMIVGMQRELAELKASDAKRRERETAAQYAEYERQWFAGAREKIKAKTDELELFMAAGEEATGLFEQSVQEYTRKNGEPPDPVETAKAVEKYLEELTLRLIPAKKIKAKFEPKAPEPPKVSEPPPKTLGSTLAPRTDTRELTPEQRLEKAKELYRAAIGKVTI